MHTYNMMGKEYGQCFPHLETGEEAKKSSYVGV